jgi:NAD(P)-dependent dehydrogenase (short-subunit alcohol dehydrogenase family)
MPTVCITGSAGGIGAATRTRLEQQGARVIGVDVRDAEVIADLSTPAGRAAMVDAVTQASGGSLDGLVAAAGIMGNESLVVAINYFGAIATLEGLRPLLAKGTDASAIAISSNSTTTTPGLPAALVDTILAGDEPAALAATAAAPGFVAYPASKLALARYVRRHAPTPEWIGAGIRLNAIAPGPIRTEGAFSRLIPTPAAERAAVERIPLGRFGEKQEIANLALFLLSDLCPYQTGDCVTMDGGEWLAGAGEFSDIRKAPREVVKAGFDAMKPRKS